MAAGNISFADYLSAIDHMNVIKEAVNGTTLVTLDEQSYIPRLKRLDPNLKPDVFVCQLSTNDAVKDLPVGTIESTGEGSVGGAVRTIIHYVRSLWKCPVAFYTGTRFNNEKYADMVRLLQEISAEEQISIIDLWSDDELNRIDHETRGLYILRDCVHPTKAGYLNWWLPVFEKRLKEIMEDYIR